MKKTTSYKSNFIAIDILKNQFKLEFGKDWKKLPSIHSITIFQIKMSQNGGGRATGTNHRYKTFCVYIKFKTSHVLAFRGTRKKSFSEAQKLSKVLKVKIIDQIPRNKNGKIDDDDQLIEPESIHSFFMIGFFIAIIVLFIIVFIL